MNDAVGRFRGLISAQLGLHLDDAKLDYLGELLRRRALANRESPVAYLARLGRGDSAEIGALAEELTVNETYFFRNMEQLTALVEVALPDRMGARAGAKTLRILSAGCATGEEPYSIAMLLRGALRDPGWKVAIRGVDINPAVLRRAASGTFSTWAMRETSPELQRAWFRTDGRDVILDPAIRDQVRFDQRNLATDDAELWQPSAYDVVFCRNVLMYFSPDVARDVVARIERSLAPGGYLFLGHAETLRGLSNAFHLCHTHGTFYYRLRDHEPATELPATTVTAVQAIEHTTSWVDAIQRATDRVRALSEQASPSLAAAPARGASRQRQAFQLLEHERFDEALALVEADGAGDPDVLLLRAVLLVHHGRLDEAEASCTHLLALDELDAGAHYVLALCREARGDRDGAIDHDGVATYLDPTFAMPRLHLGLLARRVGDRVTAQRELGQALLLLQREDASRVLLFGGGFRREALVALCRAELARAGSES